MEFQLIKPVLSGMVKLMRTSFLFSFGLVLFVLIMSAEIMACPLELPTAAMTIKGHSLTVELAATPAARVCGLSQRSELPPDRGMLFIFPDSRPRSFWMKDTFIPLSIAYLDDSGRIFSIQDMVPQQVDKHYPSVQPASYALEVNRGWFRRNGIKVGEIVEINLPLVLDIR
jgi:hypothetical protein